MRTWQPTRTVNGFFPQLSPTGTHVVYGGTATIVADLRSGEEFEFVTLGRLAHLGWLDERTIVAGLTGDVGRYGIYACDVPTRTMTEIDVPPEHAPFTAGNAAHGHWVIWYPGRPVILDGRPFAPIVPAGVVPAGPVVAGEHLLVAGGDGWVVHYRAAQYVRDIRTPLWPTLSQHGDVGFGYAGRSYLWEGNGLVDVTLTPWRRESAPYIVRVGGDVWLWSTDGDAAIVFGRRRGETEPILLEDFAATSLSIVVVGHEFVIAGADATGRLQVRWVPMDTPRRAIAPAPKPKPKPQPEPKPEPKPMPYTRLSPDYADRVAEFAARFPVLWESARERSDGSKDPAMIRALASWMHAEVDERIGLNGKRGGHSISTDALAYQNASAPGGVEVIDVILGDDHRPGWLDVTIYPGHPKDTTGKGVLGKFIQPAPWREPDDSSDDALKARIAELEAELARVWQERGELAGQVTQLRLRVTELEAQGTRPGVTYRDLETFADEVRDAYRAGELGRTQEDVPLMTALHLFWRLVVEKRDRATLIEEARARGDGQVPE